MTQFPTGVTIPIAHVDDTQSMVAVCDVLRALHGDGYDFGLTMWDATSTLHARAGMVTYAFVVRAEDARLDLHAGDRVRAPDPGLPVHMNDDLLGQAEADCAAELWPGDVFTLGPDAADSVTLHGCGLVFLVSAAASGYTAPRLALLRNLSDHPGGCAAYPGAFRRETLPPDRRATNAEDRRGVNRVNEHTLDIRVDRTPPPIRHYHGPVATGDGQVVNHSETAIVLPRHLYDRPEIEHANHGHLIIYADPVRDPGLQVRVPVMPGAIVVTPATPELTMGHCFENVFAMLIAIPGFVAPYHRIER